MSLDPEYNNAVLEPALLCELKSTYVYWCKYMEHRPESPSLTQG